MDTFFIVAGAIVILLLVFGRSAWDTMDEDQKRDANTLYSGGLYSKEEMKEKEEKLQPIYDSDGTISSWYLDDDDE